MITTAEFLRIVALIAGVLAGLLFLRALIGTQRARRAAYYSTRREASKTANRYLAMSLITAVFAGGIGVVSVLLPPEILPAAPPGLSASTALSPTPLPTIYIVPTLAPVDSPDTPTPLPTRLSTTPAVATRQAAPSRTSAAGSKYLALRAIASAVDASGRPVSSTAEFTRSVKTVYVFFDYSDVPQGALMRQTWFLNGGSVHFDSTTWARDGNGTMYIAWTPQQGFNPGLYEVRVLLGDARQFSANFMVH